MARGREAIARLVSRLQDREGQQVVYSNGAGTVTLIGVYGRKRLMLSNEDGGTEIGYADSDMIVMEADIVINGSTVEPASGHRWTDANEPDGLTRTYEVLPILNEPAKQQIGPYRGAWRIHGKLVGVA